MPSAQECQESPEECLGAGGAPDTPRSRRLGGAPRWPAQGSRPRGAPGPQRPRPAATVRAHLKPKPRCGAAAAATRTRGKEPPLFTAARENLRNIQVLPEPVFPATPSPLRGPLAALPSSPVQRARPRGGTAAARQHSPEERSGEGLPRHGRRSASPPAPHQLAMQGQPRCSLLTPGRTQRPWPLERSVFKRSEMEEESRRPRAPQRGEPPPQPRQPLQHHRATSPGAHRAPVRSRPQPCARPAPAISAGRSKRRRAPLSTPRPPVATGCRRSPHPSRAASPSEGDPPHLRAALAARRRSLARTARPLQRGRGCRGRALPGRSQAGGAPSGERGALSRPRLLGSLRGSAARAVSSG